MKRAVAYTREVLHSDSGEAIPREVQERRIKDSAAEKGIEIVGWFADSASESNVLERPGIQALLACGQQFDLVLCERAWALSRSMVDLEPFFNQMDSRGLKLECSTLLWDLVSQKCRRRSESLPVLPGVIRVLDQSKQSRRYHVVKPVRLNFVHLVH